MFFVRSMLRARVSVEAVMRRAIFQTVVPGIALGYFASSSLSCFLHFPIPHAVAPRSFCFFCALG